MVAVAVHVGGEGVAVGLGRHPDREPADGRGQLDQLRCMAELPLPVIGIDGWVATQRHQVLDPGRPVGDQDLGQLQPGVGHTDEMGHGHQRGGAQHAGDQVEGPLARLGPAPVGDRDEGRPQGLEIAEGLHQRGLFGVGLGGEEFERVGPPLGQQIGNPGHGRTSLPAVGPGRHGRRRPTGPPTRADRLWAASVSGYRGNGVPTRCGWTASTGPRSARSCGPAGPRRPRPTGRRWEPRLPDGAADRPRRRRPGRAGTRPPRWPSRRPGGRGPPGPPARGRRRLSPTWTSTAPRRVGSPDMALSDSTASRASCASLRAGTTARCHSASTPFFRANGGGGRPDTMATTSTTMSGDEGPRGVGRRGRLVRGGGGRRGGGPGRVGRRGGRRRRRGGGRHGGGGGRRGCRGRGLGGGGGRWPGGGRRHRGRPGDQRPGKSTAEPHPEGDRHRSAGPPDPEAASTHRLMGRSSRSRRRAARSCPPRSTPRSPVDRSPGPLRGPHGVSQQHGPGHRDPPRPAAG